jgi:hypothetical protein
MRFGEGEGRMRLRGGLSDYEVRGSIFKRLICIFFFPGTPLGRQIVRIREEVNVVVDMRRGAGGFWGYYEVGFLECGGMDGDGGSN